MAPDEQRLKLITTADDPLTAEAFIMLLEDASITAYARPRRAIEGLSAPLDSWWEIWVPAEHEQKASEMIAAERERLAATAEENARAAEEEEQETEAQVESPP